VVPKEQVAPLTTALGDALAQPRRVSDHTHRLVAQHFGPAAVRAAYQDVYDRIRAAGV
jgi:hypothetical protein